MKLVLFDEKYFKSQQLERVNEILGTEYILLLVPFPDCDDSMIKIIPI